MTNYEWNGYTFETKEEMVKFSIMKTKADKINDIYEDLYEETSEFYNVSKCNKHLIHNLILNIQDNYNAVDRFYNAQYMLNQLISIL